MNANKLRYSVILIAPVVMLLLILLSNPVMASEDIEMNVINDSDNNCESILIPKKITRERTEPENTTIDETAREEIALDETEPEEATIDEATREKTEHEKKKMQLKWGFGICVVLFVILLLIMVAAFIIEYFNPNIAMNVDDKNLISCTASGAHLKSRDEKLAVSYKECFAKDADLDKCLSELSKTPIKGPEMLEKLKNGDSGVAKCIIGNYEGIKKIYKGELVSFKMNPKKLYEIMSSQEEIKKLEDILISKNKIDRLVEMGMLKKVKESGGFLDFLFKMQPDRYLSYMGLDSTVGPY